MHEGATLLKSFRVFLAQATQLQNTSFREGKATYAVGEFLN